MNFTCDNTTEAEESLIPSSEVQFWTMIIFQIPSLACTIFLLYQLLRLRKLRRALHNHVIIILLFLVFGLEVFDNSLYIDAYRFGGSANSFPMTKSICLMWWIFDYGFYGAIAAFLAWGSMERHLLVFHRQYLRTQRQKFFFHYLPLMILGLYLSGFYIGVMVFPPCETSFDFESLACGLSPCYEEIHFLNIWDYFFNGIFYALIETISTCALLFRIIAQKRRANRPLNWRKHNRMAIQLLSISILNLTIVFPQSLITVVQRVGGADLADFGAALDPYFFYFYGYVVFLLPFICLCGLPELWPRKILALWKRPNGGIWTIVSVQPRMSQTTI